MTVINFLKNARIKKGKRDSLAPSHPCNNHCQFGIGLGFTCLAETTIYLGKTV